MGLFFRFPTRQTMGKAKYSKEADNPAKSCKAKGSSLRVHFKNTYETAMAIKGMNIRKAQSYLGDVVEKKTSCCFQKIYWRSRTSCSRKKCSCSWFSISLARKECSHFVRFVAKRFC